MAQAHRRVLEFLAAFRARGADAGVAAELLKDVGDSAERVKERFGEPRRKTVMITECRRNPEKFEE